QRGFEVARIVADDGDARRIDAEPKQRRREEGPIAIVPVAAHELRARRDDRRAQAGRQPVGVTMMTCGLRPGTCTSLPRTRMRRFSGVSICTHRRRPRIARAASPLAIVPSKTMLPRALLRCATRCVVPLSAVTRKSGGTTLGRCAIRAVVFAA